MTFAKGLQIGSNLAVGGNTSIGGNLTVSGLIAAGSLNVNSLTLSSLHLNGDATINGHLVPTGSAPIIHPDNAAAGGTTTIDGTDTAGTLTIVTGSDPSHQLAGELAIITFHSHFATNPRVQLTPVNAPAAALQYYVTQSPTYFSVETGSTPTAGQRYIYNYFVTQ